VNPLRVVVDNQTLIVIAIILAAAVYVGPAVADRKKQPGCSMYPRIAIGWMIISRMTKAE
jgi:hypothetical protein